MNRTSFTPRVENLETRALLTTIPGLTLEPTTDHAAQIGQSSHANNIEQIAQSQKNDAAFIKFDGIMSTPGNSDLEEIAASQKNDAAFMKFDGIMSAAETTRPAHQAAVDQLFALEGAKGQTFAGNGLWG